MKIPWRAVRLAAAAVLCSGSVTAIAAVTGTSAVNASVASASVAQAICSNPGGAGCMNRKAGGTGVGTPVVGYTRDFDNNEDFQAIQLGGWCNNGVVTSTCPFTVGSGLNNRYYGDEIVSIYSTSTNEAIGTSNYTTAILAGTGVPIGGAFVISRTNGDFLVDVGVTNYWYAQDGGVGNNPYWLVWQPQTKGQQLLFENSPANSWGCYPSGAYCGGGF